MDKLNINHFNFAPGRSIIPRIGGETENFWWSENVEHVFSGVRRGGGKGKYNWGRWTAFISGSAVDFQGRQWFGVVFSTIVDLFFLIGETRNQPINCDSAPRLYSGYCGNGQGVGWR